MVTNPRHPTFVLLTYAAALALLWGMTCDFLRLEWSANPQYAYGWFVPLLSVYLIGQRWRDRPEPQPCAGAAAVWLLLLLLLPLRLIQEANPDWRLMSWLAGGLTVVVTLAVCRVVGGRPWVRHFAIAVSFLLVAIPWPTAIEVGMIQGLTRLVTGLAVAVANGCGIPAVQHGNLIQLASGVVGVDDACSGIRSFQAAFMSAVFLGEYYRFRWSQRLLLVAVGALAALMTNAFRAFLLVWVAGTRGTDAVAGWHDPAGLFVFLACFAILFFTAIMLNRSAGTTQALPPVTQTWCDAAKCLSLWPAVTALLWMVCVLVLVETWYGRHERQAIANPGWSVRWPGAGQQARELPLTPATQVALRYDYGRGVAWRDEAAGIRWMAYYFLWQPGRTAAQMAASHSPDVCLPAAGSSLVGGPSPVQITTAVGPLAFQHYEFESSGRALHVFHCVWENFERQSQSPVQDWSARSRLAAVVAGHRHRGQQVLEIAVVGVGDAAQAVERFRATVPPLIVPSEG